MVRPARLELDDGLFDPQPKRIAHQCPRDRARDQPACGFNLGVGAIATDRLAMGIEPIKRPFLISAYQARLAGDIGGEDRGEAAGRGYPSQPALRSPSSR